MKGSSGGLDFHVGLYIGEIGVPTWHSERRFGIPRLIDTICPGFQAGTREKHEGSRSMHAGGWRSDIA
eukprot:1394646-Amorphochlora_amoeboformis.AAC.1